MNATKLSPNASLTPAATHYPIYERLHIGMLLAFVGGFLDIYTYLERGYVFANAQSGNMVLMSLSIARGHWWSGLCYALPILAYAVGTRITEHLKRRNVPHWQRAVLMLESIILFAVGFWPTNASNLLVNILISLVCSMQVSSFRKLMGEPYATTMCTGNLRSMIEEWVKFHRDGSRSAGTNFLRYFAVIGTFCVGAVVGAPLCELLHGRAIWCSAGVLLFTTILLLREAD